MAYNGSIFGVSSDISHEFTTVRSSQGIYSLAKREFELEIPAEGKRVVHAMIPDVMEGNYPIRY